MTKFLFGTKFLLCGATLALVAAAPASAQLLGGRGGGLGGGLGGSLSGMGGGLRGAGSGSLGGTFDGAASRIPTTGDIGSPNRRVGARRQAGQCAERQRERVGLCIGNVDDRRRDQRRRPLVFGQRQRLRVRVRQCRCTAGRHRCGRQRDPEHRRYRSRPGRPEPLNCRIRRVECEELCQLGR